MDCSSKSITRYDYSLEPFISLHSSETPTCSFYHRSRFFVVTMHLPDNTFRNTILTKRQMLALKHCLCPSYFALSQFSMYPKLELTFAVYLFVSFEYMRTVPREMSGNGSQQCFQAWQRRLDVCRTLRRDLEGVEVYSLRSIDSTLYTYFVCRISLVIFRTGLVSNITLGRSDDVCV